jgi:hypothetical protein
MEARNRWTEVVTCRHCGRAGPVRLSQPDGWTYDFDVEAIPAGFKVVRTEYGGTFFCSACDRPAIASCPASKMNPVNLAEAVD